MPLTLQIPTAYVLICAYFVSVVAEMSNHENITLFSVYFLPLAAYNDSALVLECVMRSEFVPIC